MFSNTPDVGAPKISDSKTVEEPVLPALTPPVLPPKPSVVEQQQGNIPIPPPPALKGGAAHPAVVGQLSPREAKAKEVKELAEAAMLTRGHRISGTPETAGAAPGQYRVMQELGLGGNSAVYLVEAMAGPYRGVLFALKVFHRITDGERLERFKTEINFLKSCSHPSILRVFDSGEHSAKVKNEWKVFPFVVSEYLPKTLRSSMLSGLTIVEKTAFTLQLLAGLSYLASRTPVIIHRDIKPENIFVKGRSAVLGDFGLLKAGDGVDPSVEYHVAGSTGLRFPRSYPTPDLIEYCKQRQNPLPLSPKSDVFQLGLVIAELFTSDIPVEPREEPFSPILIRSNIGAVLGSQGEIIKSAISKMLLLQTEHRPSATELFDTWEGIFLQLATMAQQLDGQLFAGS